MVTCERCGREFKTAQGMRGHQTFKHGMSRRPLVTTYLASTEGRLVNSEGRLEQLEQRLEQRREQLQFQQQLPQQLKLLELRLEWLELLLGGLGHELKLQLPQLEFPPELRSALLELWKSGAKS